MIEERLYVARPPFGGGVAGEGEVAEIVAVMVGARMPPRTDGEMQQARTFILRRQRLVDRRTAVAVLLVPLPDLDERRHRQFTSGEDLVDGLQRPEIRVGG